MSRDIEAAVYYKLLAIRFARPLRAMAAIHRQMQGMPRPTSPLLAVSKEAEQAYDVLVEAGWPLETGGSQPVAERPALTDIKRQEALNAAARIQESIDEECSYTGPGRYAHYKGGLYEVVGCGLLEAVPGVGPHVAYRPLSDESALAGTGLIFWFRPLDDFNAIVEVKAPDAISHTPRFRRLYPCSVCGCDAPLRIPCPECHS